MSEMTMVCPKCRESFALTDSLMAPLLASKEAEFRQALALRDEKAERITADLAQREDALRAAQAGLEQTLKERLLSAKLEVTKEQRELARSEVGESMRRKDAELEELNTVIQLKNRDLLAAQDAQADFRRKCRELDDERVRIKLTIEEQVALESDRIKREATSEAHLKLHERDIRIVAMAKQIEVLRQQVEQVPHSIQGSAQEAELTAILRQHFPVDHIERVPVGQAGGDVLHVVKDGAGKICGTILWESKRTKQCQENWLAKLKQDQKQAKADVAIIVSQALPKDLEYFEQRGDIWVAGFDCIVPVAGSLRYLLIEMAEARRSNEGVRDKARLVYAYVTSNAFKQRVQALVEAYASMQQDLHAEQKALKKQWAKRQMHLDRMSDATTAMWGDLQGIAGKEVSELDGMGFDSLGDGQKYRPFTFGAGEGWRD